MTSEGIKKMEEFALLQKDRDRKVVEIIYTFLLATRTFRQIYEKHQQGSLHFSELAKFVDDQGKSVLFILKESCHNLFRQGNPYVLEKEQIFDLTIGSIFHLAMKMREDLYQLEFYGPKYLELSHKGDGTMGPEDLILQFTKITTRARLSISEGIEEIDALFQGLLLQFQDLLVEYRENGLLIRFFLEESDLLQEVLGKDFAGDIFRILYGPEEVEGYRLAGESYFRSAFYTRAIKAFSRALEKTPGDESLQLKIYLSQGMEQFYSLDPLQALGSFEKCLPLARRVEFLETYRTMVRNICQKIQEEFPGRRKTDKHRDLVKKAASLQRQLDELPPAPSDIYPT